MVLLSFILYFTVHGGGNDQWANDAAMLAFWANKKYVTKSLETLFCTIERKYCLVVKTNGWELIVMHVSKDGLEKTVVIVPKDGLVQIVVLVM